MAVSTNTALIPVGAWTPLVTNPAAPGVLIQTSSPIKIAYASSPPPTLDGFVVRPGDRPFLFPATTGNIYATAIGAPANVGWITPA